MALERLTNIIILYTNCLNQNVFTLFWHDESNINGQIQHLCPTLRLRVAWVCYWCVTLCCVFQWEKALSLAPGVSMAYWKALASRWRSQTYLSHTAHKHGQMYNYYVDANIYLRDTEVVIQIWDN